LPQIHYRKILFCKDKGLKQIFNVYLTRNPLQKQPEYSRVYRCPHTTLNDICQTITPLATEKLNLSYLFDGTQISKDIDVINKLYMKYNDSPINENLYQKIIESAIGIIIESLGLVFSLGYVHLARRSHYFAHFYQFLT
jgi:hypothetical protein